MSEPMSNEEFIKTITKEEAFNSWVEACEKLKAEYAKNVELKRENKFLAEQLKVIRVKLRAIVSGISGV